MFGTHLSRLGSVHRLGLVHKAIGILRKYGTDAHIYLPGIGTVNGITAGNYLDSAGVTAATVDNPVGLSLDALQAMTLGSENVVGSSNVGNNGWTPVGSGGIKVVGGATGSLYGPYGSFVPTYLMVVVVVAISGTITPYLGNSIQTVITTPGTYQYVVKPTAGSYFYLDAPAATTATVSSVSIKQIPGIHATQATTANKPILRQSAGRYSWQFDGVNDSLSLSDPLFQMSDDHCVIAGANCTTSSAATIAQIAGKNTGPQAAGLSYAAGGFITATWSDDAALNKSIADPASRLNSNNVATAIKIGNNKRLRVNGVQIGAVESTAMGVATFNTGSIGCATWANNYMQGSIYPVIAIKGTVSDADLLTLERFVGQLSGVSI